MRRWVLGVGAMVVVVGALAAGVLVATRARRTVTDEPAARPPTRSMVRAARLAEQTRQPVLQATTTIVVGAFPPLRTSDGERAVDPGRRMGPCVGGLIQPRPPVCGSVSITNWVWPRKDGITDGIEEDQGVRWADYRIVGTFDVDRQAFTLTEMPVPKDELPPDPDDRRRSTEPPCPPPPGGWLDPDATRNGPTSAQRLKDLARRSPDFVQLSITEHPGPDVWTVAFTGDLERHRRELRMVWGGGLCLVEKPVSAKTLDAWRAELEPQVLDGEFGGLWWTGFGASPETGTIVLSAAWAPPGTEERLSAEYGIPISIERWLQPAT